MKLRSLPLLALLAAPLVPPTQARTLVLNVATNGNDAWSGEFSYSVAGQTNGPLASVGAAITRARETRQRLPGFDGVTILLRTGTYPLSGPIVLHPDDSGGDPAHPFLLAPYPNEKPVLSGGERITGWTAVNGKPGQWQAIVPAVHDGKWYFRQLFVNGHRRQRARTPNEGFFRIQGESPKGNPAQLKFKPGDIRAEWAAEGEVELVALLAWADLRMPIRAVDTNANVVTLTGEPRESNRETDAQYYIENSRDGLDQAGEWYLDRKTGIVTYWALPGEDLDVVEVIAPRLRELLVMEGDFTGQRPVQNVMLRGLTFTYTDWDLGPQGYADTQAAVAVRGDVRAEGAVDCSIADCVFTRLAGYGLELGRGCQRFRVIGNEFVDLGAGGVRIGETAVRSVPFEHCNGHVVTDNHLHDLGQVNPAAVGVFVLQSGNNQIAHNEIHDLSYTAISVGWTWGYVETPCHDNLIAFNHLHDVGQGRLSDMGGIYTLGIQKGTVIRNNLIHDVKAFTYGGWGLYTDEGSTGILLENNLVYRCKSAGFHQHYGRQNVIRNNIFAFNTEHQLMRSREEEHLSFTFTNNIVYFDSGDLLGSSWKNDRFKLDGNLYFDARPEARPETMRFAGTTLGEWQRRGHDLLSVIADPLFINPGKFNFRLSPNSPAFRLGFKPLDLSTVGVRKRGERKREPWPRNSP